jgi:hypothetical protein
MGVTQIVSSIKTIPQEQEIQKIPQRRQEERRGWKISGDIEMAWRLAVDIPLRIPFHVGSRGHQTGSRRRERTQPAFKRI